MDDHYGKCAIEPIHYITSNGMDFIEGNIIKYVSRYKHKSSPMGDLRKARQYLDWLIERESKRCGDAEHHDTNTDIGEYDDARR